MMMASSVQESFRSVEQYPQNLLRTGDDGVQVPVMAIAIDAGAYYNVEKPRFANDWYSQILVNFLLPK